MNTISELIQREATDEDFDLLEAVNLVAETSSWNEVVAQSVAILSDRSVQGQWGRAMVVCYWAAPRASALPIAKMQLVARLYWCLLRSDDSLELDGNLVWSIAIDLKGVSYESEWDPMRDPEIIAFIEAMDQPLAVPSANANWAQ